MPENEPTKNAAFNVWLCKVTPIIIVDKIARATFRHVHHWLTLNEHCVYKPSINVSEHQKPNGQNQEQIACWNGA